MSKDEKEQPVSNLSAPPAPKKPTLEEIVQVKVQKLLTKYNAKAVMDQETSETLQDFINTVMPALKEQGEKIKALEAKVKELEAKLPSTPEVAKVELKPEKKKA